MHNAPQILIDRVQPLLIQLVEEEGIDASRALDAVKVALIVYTNTLQKLKLSSDFDRQRNEELAAEAAEAQLLQKIQLLQHPSDLLRGVDIWLNTMYNGKHDERRPGDDYDSD